MKSAAFFRPMPDDVIITADLIDRRNDEPAKYPNVARVVPVADYTKIRGRPVRGYVLERPVAGRASHAPLAFIETLAPSPRLVQLIEQCIPFGVTARECIRTVLNAEDYRSGLYDNIVRVYYPEDWQ